MSEAIASMWAPRSAWAGYAKPGRHGRTQGEAGVRLTLRDGIGLATVIVADGQTDALRALVSERYGWTLPEPGRAQLFRDRGLVWSAPGQWLAVAETREALRDLPQAFRGVAAVTDQSDGRAVVRVSGRNARTVLEKGVAVDLHPRAFQAGQTAATSIAHIGAQLWQLDDVPTYDVAVARSFAGSFWSWLTEAAAEFGYEVEQGPAH
ncbi:sarcosine oxidase subunit gamma [Methylobacterium gnaphalii]|uniref:Sarcosine oxidase subunit gamma n=1 Tax=Methylobacterium gnaphalii TaxID=1010610 RepID=A0A512JK68_9HYPH|nr:sarcosine oxidase subunit gamma family protein [Methylobacterium gnaphalii]GEP10347.1 hypothetical protein MGN01_21920 [Methylobacterium gnaphalii]GJD68506.1 hypothetical protein MMMDOFMJ_1429 [Methylobacterium gnaphalii]GLS51275.1 hypothetical protein GCM10007885_41300 [Methylobacterium gnaphalii]